MIISVILQVLGGVEGEMVVVVVVVVGGGGGGRVWWPGLMSARFNATILVNLTDG